MTHLNNNPTKYKFSHILTTQYTINYQLFTVTTLFILCFFYIINTVTRSLSY